MGVLARLTAGGFAASIIATLIIAAVAPASWGAAIAADGPGCPFRRLTGIDCPFCGMTRATVAMGHGRWHDALVLHPLAPLVLAGTLFLLALVALGRSDALVRGRRPMLLLATIGVVWVVRLIV